MPTPIRPDRLRTAGVTIASLAIAVALAAAVAAQQPRIANGRVTAQPAASPLAPRSDRSSPSQPDVAGSATPCRSSIGERVMCCFGRQQLELGNGMSSDGSAAAARAGWSSLHRHVDARRAAASRAGGVVKLEGSDRIVVLYRDRGSARRPHPRVLRGLRARRGRPGGAVARERAAGRQRRAARVVHGAGRRRQEPDRRRRHHRHRAARRPAADASLERLVATSQPESLRKKVTFWLGNARGRRGFDDAAPRAARRSERRGPQERGVRRCRRAGCRRRSTRWRRIARSDSEPRLRSEALFWLAQKGDARAAKVITDALEKDASAEVRKKAVFALSQLKEEAGVPALIQIARTHTDAATRGEAIFWLGQKAGSKASAAITDRIEQDPDTEVKKKAVFALSQLPKDEGVPLLIKVARTNTNPAVRKQAMFWLGQSRDPRAIDFFAEVLK